MGKDRPIALAKRVQSAPQQIVSHIKELILEGVLQPGMKLPTENEMAEAFAVSRPTVREALRYLRVTHVLDCERGRNGGYRVAELSLRELEANVGELISLSLVVKNLDYTQLFEVRQALEILSASVAAIRRTEDDLIRLTRALPDPYPSQNDYSTVLNSDLLFHRTLAECTHNPLIAGFAGATAVAFRRFAADTQKATPELLVAHLPEIVEAVQAKDATAARDAMKRHLSYFAQYFGVDQT